MEIKKISYYRMHFSIPPLQIPRHYCMSPHISHMHASTRLFHTASWYFASVKQTRRSHASIGPRFHFRFSRVLPLTDFCAKRSLSQSNDFSIMRFFIFILPKALSLHFTGFLYCHITSDRLHFYWVDDEPSISMHPFFCRLRLYAGLSVLLISYKHHAFSH